MRSIKIDGAVNRKNRAGLLSGTCLEAILMKITMGNELRPRFSKRRDFFTWYPSLYPVNPKSQYG
jgi:hypothetical protein